MDHHLLVIPLSLVDLVFLVSHDLPGLLVYQLDLSLPRIGQRTECMCVCHLGGGGGGVHVSVSLFAFPGLLYIIISTNPTKLTELEQGRGVT